MTDYTTFGASGDVTYLFAKTFVHDLDAMASFYESVFGLISIQRHTDTMLGREIDEVSYQPTYQGGPSLTLIKYLDSTGPSTGESVQGFLTPDLAALCERATAAGGTVPEGIRAMPEMGLQVAFVLDPEGHLNEVVQLSQPQ